MDICLAAEALRGLIFVMTMRGSGVLDFEIEVENCGERRLRGMRWDRWMYIDVERA